MTKQVDNLMQLADDYADQYECSPTEGSEQRQALRAALEAALKECRSATLEEAAKAVDKLADDKTATHPQQFALDLASDVIRSMK